MKEKPIH